MKKYYTKDYVDNFGVVRVYGCYDDERPLNSRPREWVADLLILEIDDYRVKLERSKHIVRKEDTRHFKWIGKDEYEKAVNDYLLFHNSLKKLVGTMN